MLALIMGALMVSCTTQEEEKEITRASDVTEGVQELITDLETLSPEEAQAMIRAYWPLKKELLDCVDNQGRKVPQYIHIPHNELQKMVAGLGDDPAQLYGCMVEKELAGVKYTAMVFAGKKTEKSEWAYFDFTHPCPPACDTLGLSGGGGN